MSTGNVITGESIKDALLKTIASMTGLPGARTRVGDDGVRIDIPEMPPFLLRKRTVRHLFFFTTVVYEINHDSLYSRLTKLEYEMACASVRMALQEILKKREEKRNEK